jgi:hypothetical protein
MTQGSQSHADFLIGLGKNFLYSPFGRVATFFIET